ncbi:hypothetical protein CEXT_692001 [Caerostris extrusa]|uniref:Uncharacterized protein n=1 Tax=Caerostris extrusa TaxID=172846 RepID=A0AAV4VFD4_CAEEX|nr:hypothetical protein CEXT_692001 [Caerostris extrusa]
MEYSIIWASKGAVAALDVPMLATMAMELFLATQLRVRRMSLCENSARSKQGLARALFGSGTVSINSLSLYLSAGGKMPYSGYRMMSAP